MVHNTEDFFRNQVEECLELAKQARNDEDRAFWERLGKGWTERLLHVRKSA